MSGPTALKAVNWERVLPRITAFALRRLGRGGAVAEAEDIATEAISQLYDPKYKPWDPAERDLMFELGSRVNGIILNRRRKKTELLGEDAEEVHALDTEHRGSHPDDAIAARQTLDRVLARVQKDALVEQLVMLIADGVTKPSEQAAALNRPVKDIYNARRRLDDHAEVVRREERAVDA